MKLRYGKKLIQEWKKVFLPCFVYAILVFLFSSCVTDRKACEIDLEHGRHTYGDYNVCTTYYGGLLIKNSYGSSGPDFDQMLDYYKALCIKYKAKELECSEKQNRYPVRVRIIF